MIKIYLWCYIFFSHSQILGLTPFKESAVFSKFLTLPNHYILCRVADKTINNDPGFRKQVPGFLWHYKGLVMDKKVMHKLDKTIDMQVKKRLQ